MLKKFLLALALAVLTLTPSVTKIAYAQENPAVAKGVPYWGPILSCEGSPEQVEKAKQAGADIPKVCSNLCDLFATAQNGIYFILTLLLFIAVPLSLVVGGLMMIFGGSAPKIAQQGKNIVWTTIGGAALALCAFLVVNTFLFLLSLSTTDSQGKAGIAWGNITCKVPEAQPLQQTPSGNGDVAPQIPPGCENKKCGDKNPQNQSSCFGTCDAGKSCNKNPVSGEYSCIEKPADTNNLCGSSCDPTKNNCQKQNNTYVCCEKTATCGQSGTGGTCSGPCESGRSCTIFENRLQCVLNGTNIGDIATYCADACRNKTPSCSEKEYCIIKTTTGGKDIVPCDSTLAGNTFIAKCGKY